MPISCCLKLSITASLLVQLIASVFPLEASAEPGKVGEVRSLPGLQTRARPPLLPGTLHIGMWENRFFEYAKDNNWAAIATVQRQDATRYDLQPGGEGVYALPNLDLVYARGFTAHVYFDKGRLVGIKLTQDTRDRSLTFGQLLTLVRAWFPDDMLSVVYQVIPADPKKRVLESLIGSLPTAFNNDLGQANLPFCRTVIFPAPVPINSLLSTCPQTAS